MILRALHELAAPSAGQLKSFKWFKASESAMKRVTQPGDFMNGGENEIASAVVKLPTVVVII